MQVSRFVSLGALKHYFNVSNSYVLNKLFLVLFPWRHKPWSRKQSVGPNGQEGWYLPPRDDINSPDMYIPVMSLVTYIFLSALIAGLQGKFQPELFGYTASTALILVLIEILGLKFGCYLLNISNESQLLDLVAYSGYKFVGVIATICIGEIVNGGKGTGGWVGWGVFLYVFLANSLFLVQFQSATSTRKGVWLTLIFSDAFVALRAPARDRRQQSGADATQHGYEGKKKPEDAVPVLLRLSGAALFHVGTLPGLEPASENSTKECGGAHVTM